MPLPADIVQALVRTIELKDRCTAAHTWRVVLYTRLMAERHGLTPAQVSRLSVAAALHDVGKIDVPDDILTKPGKLTPEEFEVIKTHTTLGHHRLVRMGEDDPLVLELVRHHHERVDGGGYPDGLAADRIPMAAKYFSVVDSFDALTSVRPYRADVGHGAGERAVAELRAGAGTRYAPECVEALAALFEAGELDWILEEFHDKVELPTFSCPTYVQDTVKKVRG
jgi:HD-GYP domain-containing protein (c-di-GMP phosphodiesterase class II)